MTYHNKIKSSDEIWTLYADLLADALLQEHVIFNIKLFEFLRIMLGLLLEKTD
jgi:hypothetical protein